MELYTEDVAESQSGHPTAGLNCLSRADRRLLLGGSLRILVYRFACGKPILELDLLRIASFSDDASGRAT